MKGKICREYSNRLRREMEYKVFGDAGKLCIAFPTRGGRYYDFENFGMVETIAPMIESGKIQLVLVDSIDHETWLAADRDPHQRIMLHQAWAEYVVHDLLPTLRSGNSDDRKAIVTGCDLGATHAANFIFRRPDLFDTLIALSGVYKVSAFYGDFINDLVCANSPVTFLSGIPEDHPWVRLYRESNIILCSGRGRWEDESFESTSELDSILTAMDINHRTDFWGFDVTHDWYWWRKELPYFMESLDL